MVYIYLGRYSDSSIASDSDLSYMSAAACVGSCIRLIDYLYDRRQLTGGGFRDFGSGVLISVSFVSYSLSYSECGVCSYSEFFSSSYSMVFYIDRYCFLLLPGVWRLPTSRPSLRTLIRHVRRIS